MKIINSSQSLTTSPYFLKLLEVNVINNLIFRSNFWKNLKIKILILTLGSVKEFHTSHQINNK